MPVSKHGLNLRIRGDADLAALETVRVAAGEKTHTKAVLLAVRMYPALRAKVRALEAETRDLRCRLAALAERGRALDAARQDLQAALEAEANRQ